jgi:hypothetical protein
MLAAPTSWTRPASHRAHRYRPSAWSKLRSDSCTNRRSPAGLAADDRPTMGCHAAPGVRVILRRPGVVLDRRPA